MKKQKGVSLITLIITIVVMIILAGVIILSLQRTNTIGKANEAKFKQNISNYFDELNSYIAEQLLEDPTYNAESLNLYGTDVKTAIPSMGDEDTQIFSVVGGKLTVNEDADDDYKNWAQDVGVEVSGEISVGSSPAVSNAPTTSAPVTSAPVTSAPAISAVPTALSLSSIKAAIVADTNPGYTQIGTTYGTYPVHSSTMTRVAQQYYGKPVAYSANGITDWQLFYIDDSNVYLISTDYVPYNKLPGYDSTTGNGDMTKGYNESYNAFFDETNSMKTEILATNKMIARGYMPLADMNTFGMETTTVTNGKYVVQSGGSINENFKSALYLLDETKWSSFVNTAQKGESAYGGPTARMIVASTNEYWGTNVAISASSKKGYTFSGHTIPRSSKWSCFWPVVTDSVYTITSPTNAEGYWIAGPTDFSYDNLYHVVNFGSMGGCLYDDYTFRVSCTSFSKL